MTASHDLTRLSHCCPGPAVFLETAQPLTEDAFRSAMGALGRPGAVAGDMKHHWRMLEARAAGDRPWDSVTTMVWDVATVEEAAAAGRARLTPTNLARESGYVTATYAGLRITVDLFNPQDELRVGYAGAGAPVLAVLLELAAPGPSPDPHPIRRRLPDPLLAALRECSEALSAAHVCGSHSLHPLLVAYLEGRAPRHASPWSFLHALHLLPPGAPVSPDTEFDGRTVGMLPRRARVGLVQHWPKGTLLITRGGLDGVLSWEHFAAARLLGLTSACQLVEGRA